ncbi:hypothetical protein EJ03DRAFT_325662 [Teratosphaeria nubilosa]|uniref:Uncharacterized protein n=1 Tax=Teratosphaeria nubilosa TaxID=161662 RepID=A0A6G1LEC5_9PEZI|nr:hypothetical protein EJ03DRAFT_325662 [Teratosphaeria nubilosa]
MPNSGWHGTRLRDRVCVQHRLRADVVERGLKPVLLILSVMLGAVFTEFSLPRRHSTGLSSWLSQSVPTTCCSSASSSSSPNRVESHRRIRIS